METTTALERRHRLDVWGLVVVALFGVLAGAFSLHNTSLGWHLASGRWMLDRHQVLSSDPFTFTATGREWVDHEWGFQVLVALVERAGGAHALIALRCLLIAGIAVVLYLVGAHSGLAPPVATALVVLCLLGARMRFFLRPELCTLLVASVVVWVYQRRRELSAPALLMWTGGMMVLGANLHGGAVVIPALLGVLWVGEMAQVAWNRWRHGRDLDSGLVAATAAVLVALLAPLVNPHGVKLYLVPFAITRLVGQAHIPNPEWVSPSPLQVPGLYAALVVGVVVLCSKQRRLATWLLFLVTAALALRYVRNVGLFFVLLPHVVAGALARWQQLSTGATWLGVRRLRGLAWCGAVVVSLSASIWLFARPFHPLGLEYAPSKYPISACDFLEREGLLSEPLYNDVNFGGYLIGRFFPPKQVFQDDRNEVSEPVLRQLYGIFQTSDISAWNELLQRYGITTALVRYHQPLVLHTAAGSEPLTRGFSAVYFPPRRWALVYWDDVAMVLVRRDAPPLERVLSLECNALRPDDLQHLERQLGTGAVDLTALRAEIARKLAEDPECTIARRLAAELTHSLD